MPIPLVDSPYLVAVPAVDLSVSFIVSPASYANWAACIVAFLASAKKQLLLQAGDYRPWGPCDRRHLMGSGASAADPKVIRYYGTDDTVRASSRVGTANEAICDGIQFATSGIAHWFIHGLTFREQTAAPNASEGATGIVFDYCLVEYFRTYGVRFRESYDCTYQRGVIRFGTNNSLTFPPTTTGDSVGINIGNVSRNVLGVKILDCEIYNVGDAIQVTDGNQFWLPVETIIDGCEGYLTPDYYIGGASGTTTWSENALDFKAGSDVANSTYVRNFRAWGWRFCAALTSSGECVTIQKYARNLKFESCIFDDSPMGFADYAWLTTLHAFTADSTTNTLTKSGHNFTTGQGPMAATTNGTLPAGLAIATDYWIIKIDTNTFQLAASAANALAATPIPVTITTNGTGTNNVRMAGTASRNTTVDGCHFVEIRDRAVTDTGAAIRPLTGVAFTNCKVANCDYLFESSPPTYYAPTFTGFSLYGVGAIQRPEDQTPPVPYDASLNTTVTGSRTLDIYERRRWTGPEWAYCATTLDGGGHMFSNTTEGSHPHMTSNTTANDQARHMASNTTANDQPRHMASNTTANDQSRHMPSNTTPGTGGHKY